MTGLFSKFPSPFLLGDIGGTNARFSMINSQNYEEQIFPTDRVSDFQNIDDAIEQRILPLAREKPHSLILAVAAPVEGDTIPLTNSHWVIDVKALIRRFALKSVFVINDFEAQALATAVLEEVYLKKIGHGTMINSGSRVVLGPGTGLGVAGITYADKRYFPVAGEGGHVDFSARTGRDMALFPHFLHNHNPHRRVSFEDILSGRGLIRLYEAICIVDGIQAVFDKADAITGAAHHENQPQAKEAVDLFLTYLARFAGDFALIFKAHGGVYIGGGIIPKIMRLIDENAFRTHFEDKHPHQNMLATIPVFIMTHPRAALEGLAAFARQPEHFLIDYKNRLWTAQSRP
ncbi:MAG: glucokinase [Candidatus Tokpelaia sp. JSC085]|nr:MAG: glucokinase [Candidatus Tokpelaia sp. JSC085]